MTQPIESWTHETIQTNGIRLHYVTQGEGELMLMLHGFPEFWYSWRHQIPEFARDYKVVALDLRGYNDSEKPPEKSAYVMPEFIADIRGVIRGLGYERCILVAHDWGGAIAWTFAEAHPEMLDGLIVLNLPHPAKFRAGLRTIAQLKKSWYVFAFQLPWLPEWVFRRNNYQAIAAAFYDMAIDKSAFPPADLQAFQEAAAKPGALTAMLNYYRNIFQGFFKPKSCQIIETPTLMVWGENDIALGKELTYDTQEYVRELEIRYIPNCSHWVQQERPQLVNRYIREFLAKF
ncbi:MAG: alpha/beta hydrolase [Cyanobacteriota bacterium]|nr:alpha/beta hydrolase [Cyanobacteriota bacterium]